MDRRYFEQTLLRRISRRRLAGVGVAALAGIVSLPGRPARALGASAAHSRQTPSFAGDPFTLGVASGDPLPESVVLWTRLAPDPENGGGMEPDPVEVSWEMAKDDRFAEIVQAGTEVATSAFAHSVHVDVTGLEPGRDYFYRFMTGAEVSPVGRTKTAPAAGAAVDRLRFGFASCAHWEHGYFAAYRHLAAEDLDLVLFLGDYLYEYASGGEAQAEMGGPVRLTGSGETTTLAEYRARHALYKTDPDLQAAHAAFPWVATWDDHEVENNYAGAVSADGGSIERFAARRAAAYQAYYEHMPLRPESMPHGPELRLYRRLNFGALAELSVLDTRQYRSDQPCGDTVGARCEAALDPALTLTGPEQERWLLDGLAASSAQWNVIAQQVMMAQIDGDNRDDQQQFVDDFWDGYPLARARILDHIQTAGVANPVILTGDVHSAWVNDVKADFADPGSPTVATELVTTSVSANNPLTRQLPFLVPFNPHVKFLDLRHGYARCEVTPAQWQTDFRALETARDPEAAIETVATFVIENGRPGADRA